MRSESFSHSVLISFLALSQLGLRSRPLSTTLIKPVFTQGRGAHQMFLPIPKYGHGQNARGGACYVRPSVGPQTMPLPHWAICNCLTTGYSFPLEKLAAPLWPVPSSLHIPGLPLLNALHIPGHCPRGGLLMGRGVRSRACITAGRGVRSQPICRNSGAPGK